MRAKYSSTSPRQVSSPDRNAEWTLSMVASCRRNGRAVTVASCGSAGRGGSVAYRGSGRISETLDRAAPRRVLPRPRPRRLLPHAPDLRRPGTNAEGTRVPTEPFEHPALGAFEEWFRGPLNCLQSLGIRQVGPGPAMDAAPALKPVLTHEGSTQQRGIRPLLGPPLVGVLEIPPGMRVLGNSLSGCHEGLLGTGLIQQTRNSPFWGMRDHSLGNIMIGTMEATSFRGEVARAS